MDHTRKKQRARHFSFAQQEVTQLEQICSKAYQEYDRALFRYCYYRIGDQERANDLVQEIFCRFWKYLLSGRRVENVRAFLYRITTNITIDEIRKKKSLSLNQMLENGFPFAAPPKETMSSYFARYEVQEIMQKLDKRCSDAITMKYLEGFSNKEISLAFNETINNIYIRIHRGFKKARVMFQHQYRYSTG